MSDSRHVNQVYDPFARGSFPAGTKSFEWNDATRDRSLPVDVWYPATDAHRGQDLVPETQDKFQPFALAPAVTQEAVRDAEAREGRFPLVIFSHGFGGVKTQSTFFCTHLASHGYVVAAMNHVGNTTLDMMRMATAPPSAGFIDTFMSDRPADASFVIDRMLAGDSGLVIDPSRIGISGHSFGGWTTLNTAGRDPRIRAALPLAPAGGTAAAAPGEIPNALRDGLTLDWDRGVPTLYLVAELDTVLPLDGMRDLFARTREPRRGIVLLNSDHFHFCDRVEQTHDMFKQIGPLISGSAGDPKATEQMTAAINGMKSSQDLAPGAHAYALNCGLGLAHMDAHVRDNRDAMRLLEGDLCALMAGRGIQVAELENCCS